MHGCSRPPHAQSLVGALLFSMSVFVCFCLFCPKCPIGKGNRKEETTSRWRPGPEQGRYLPSVALTDISCSVSRVEYQTALAVDDSDIILISGASWLVSPLRQRPAWANLTLGRF